MSSSLTTGMHGTELRGSERRAFSLSAPQPAVSPPAGSVLSGTPQPFLLSSPEPVARNGLSLACNGSRFLRVPFQGPRSRPASSPPARQFPNPFGLLLHRRFRLAPSRRLLRFGPLLVRCRARPAASPVSAPPTGSFVPLGIKAFYRIGSRSVRLPSPPDLLSLPAPVSITSSETDQSSWFATSRRLAVPQTSWNLPHYAAERDLGQEISGVENLFSSTFFPLRFSSLNSSCRGSLVEKTRGAESVLAY